MKYKLISTFDIGFYVLVVGGFLMIASIVKVFYDRKSKVI